MVDFGSFAPVNSFINAFREADIDISVKQARLPMGLNKIDHVKAIFGMTEIENQFLEKYGRKWNGDDVEKVYDKFKNELLVSLKEYAEPIDGVAAMINSLRSKNILIGSTTGYTSEMMEIVRPIAEEKGLSVDCCIASDLVPAGRPAPYMIFENMIELKVDSLDAVIKIGDTIADIKEGVNAKVISVGVIKGGNELGMTKEELDTANPDELNETVTGIETKMREAGADYVLDNILELPRLIEIIEKD